VLIARQSKRLCPFALGGLQSPGFKAPRNRGSLHLMTIGGSLFLIALGAILRFAVNDSIKDVDLSTVGLILMIVGIVGLVLGLFLARRDRAVVVDERPPRY